MVRKPRKKSVKGESTSRYGETPIGELPATAQPVPVEGTIGAEAPLEEGAPAQPTATPPTKPEEPSIEERVYAFLTEHGEVDHLRIARELGLDRSEVTKTLVSLHKQGKVQLSRSRPRPHRPPYRRSVGASPRRPRLPATPRV